MTEYLFDTFVCDIWLLSCVCGLCAPSGWVNSTRKSIQKTIQHCLLASCSQVHAMYALNTCMYLFFSFDFRVPHRFNWILCVLFPCWWFAFACTDLFGLFGSVVVCVVFWFCVLSRNHGIVKSSEMCGTANIIGYYAMRECPVLCEYCPVPPLLVCFGRVLVYMSGVFIGFNSKCSALCRSVWGSSCERKKKHWSARWVKLDTCTRFLAIYIYSAGLAQIAWEFNSHMTFI